MRVRKRRERRESKRKNKICNLLLRIQNVETKQTGYKNEELKEEKDAAVKAQNKAVIIWKKIINAVIICKKINN